MMVLPAALIWVAPAGTVTEADGPTAVMRPLVTTIVPLFDGRLAGAVDDARAGEGHRAGRRSLRVRRLKSEGKSHDCADRDRRQTSCHAKHVVPPNRCCPGSLCWARAYAVLPRGFKKAGRRVP